MSWNYVGAIFTTASQGGKSFRTINELHRSAAEHETGILTAQTERMFGHYVEGRFPRASVHDVEPDLFIRRGVVPRRRNLLFGDRVDRNHRFDCACRAHAMPDRPFDRRYRDLGRAV